MSNGRGKLKEFKKFNKDILDKIQKEGPESKLMNKKGSGIGAVAGSIPMTGGALGMAGSRVKQLLDELAKETEASKKNVMGMDKITGSLPGAGRAASKIVKGTTNLLKSKKRGGMNTDGVVDLTTEMVIDE